MATGPYSDIPRRSTTMMSRMRQATATIKSSTSGHSHLAMVIYQDKCMREALHKVGTAKLNLSKAIMEWIKNEKNPYTRELATQMAELDRMWIRAHDEYNEQYSAHRNTFKEILKGAKLIDEKVRKTDSQHKKVNKLKKQIEHAQKKQDSIKQAALETDLEHESNLYREAAADLEYYRDQHEKFKFLKFQEAYQVQCDSGNLLQSKCAHISAAREKLISACPKTVRAANEAENLAQLQEMGQNILNELAGLLDIPRPRSESSEPARAAQPNRASSIEGSLSELGDDEAIYSTFPRSEIADRDSDTETAPVTPPVRPLPDTPVEEPTSPTSPLTSPQFPSFPTSELSPPASPDVAYYDDQPVYGNVDDYDAIYDTADNYTRYNSVVRPESKTRAPPPRPPQPVSELSVEVPVEEDQDYSKEDLYANQSVRDRKSKKKLLLRDPSAESTPL